MSIHCIISEVHMKQFMSLPQQVATNSKTSTQSSSSLPISNSEMQQLLKQGQGPSQVSNSERIEELERADLITDIGGLVVPEMNGVNAVINGVKGASQSPCETSIGRAKRNASTRAPARSAHFTPSTARTRTRTRTSATRNPTRVASRVSASFPK